MKILITGANRGLGFHLAAAGLKRGHAVVAGVRTPEHIGQPLEQLKLQYPERLQIVRLDVTSEQSVMEAAQCVKNGWGSLDAVINNAAVLLEREKVIEELDMNRLLYTFEVNTFGPVRVIKHFLPLIYYGKNQVIINITSEAGSIMNAFPTNYPYSMSKTALNMFSERLREYVKDRGIRVYAVHPGWIRTDMGGEQAPGDPEITARSIYEIMENQVRIYSKIACIDIRGRPMPL